MSPPLLPERWRVEVSFPDAGTASILLGRQSQPPIQKLSSGEVERQAKELARTEQDKLAAR